MIVNRQVGVHQQQQQAGTAHSVWDFAQIAYVRPAPLCAPGDETAPIRQYEKCFHITLNLSKRCLLRMLRLVGDGRLTNRDAHG